MSLLTQYLEDTRNTIPQTFTQWMKQNDLTLQDLKNEFDIKFPFDYPAKNEAISWDDFKNDLMDRYQGYVYKYRNLKFPLSLYRSVQLEIKDIQKLSPAETKEIERYKKIGIYWTDQKSSAKPYGANHKGKRYILKTVITDDSIINWKETVQHNINPVWGEEEQEIQLYHNRTLTIESIEDESKKIIIPIGLKVRT